jgi:hypothetical protein
MRKTIFIHLLVTTSMVLVMFFPTWKSLQAQTGPCIATPFWREPKDVNTPNTGFTDDRRFTIKNGETLTFNILLDFQGCNTEAFEIFLAEIPPSGSGLQPLITGGWDYTASSDHALFQKPFEMKKPGQYTAYWKYAGSSDKNYWSAVTLTGTTSSYTSCDVANIFWRAKDSSGKTIDFTDERKFPPNTNVTAVIETTGCGGFKMYYKVNFAPKSGSGYGAETQIAAPVTFTPATHDKVGKNVAVNMNKEGRWRVFAWKDGNEAGQKGSAWIVAATNAPPGGTPGGTTGGTTGSTTNPGGVTTGSTTSGNDGLVIDNPVAYNDLLEFFFSLLKRAIGFVGILATIMIIIGGYRMVVSQGNPDGYKKGKKTVLYALGGLALVLLSFSMVAAVQNILRVK